MEICTVKCKSDCYHRVWLEKKYTGQAYVPYVDEEGRRAHPKGNWELEIILYDKGKFSSAKSNRGDEQGSKWLSTLGRSLTFGLTTTPMSWAPLDRPIVP